MLETKRMTAVRGLKLSPFGSGLDTMIPKMLKALGSMNTAFLVTGTDQ